MKRPKYQQPAQPLIPQPGQAPPEEPQLPSKEPRYMEVKDLLLPLVGALWGCANLVLSLVLELNKIRDKVLIGKDSGTVLNREHRLLLLQNDRLPLGLFLVLLCGAFGWISKQRDNEAASVAARSCYTQ